MAIQVRTGSIGAEPRAGLPAVAGCKANVSKLFLVKRSCLKQDRSLAATRYDESRPQT
jgi:hypothetical protein